MTERHNRRELGDRLSVSWSPALAARVRRRLDATIVTRRRRRRALILALGLLAMGGASYAFSYAWRIPRLETTPAPAPAPPAHPAATSASPPPLRPKDPAAGNPASAAPAGAPAVAPRPQPAAAPARAASVPETVDALLAAADAARLQGRPGDAVAPLTAILTRFPSDPRAPVAAFQLGRVLDDDLHDHAAAAAAFSRALALDPRGPLAPDAAARARAALDRATAGMARP